MPELDAAAAFGQIPPEESREWLNHHWFSAGWLRAAAHWREIEVGREAERARYERLVAAVHEFREAWEMPGASPTAAYLKLVAEAAAAVCAAVAELEEA